MDSVWTGSAITGATAVFSAYLGFFGTVWQTRIQRRGDRDKREQDLKARKFDIYNRVLREHGAHSVVHINAYSAEMEQLNTRVYRDHIRPVLFEGLHLVDPDVRTLVRRLDASLAEIDFLATVAGWPDNEAATALADYMTLINLIDSKYLLG